MFTKSKIVIAVIILGFLAAAGWWLKPRPLEGIHLSDEEVKNYAEIIVDQCQGESYGPTCYEERVPQLLGKISLEEALLVARVIQSLDQSYGNCHVLAHKLSYEEAKRSNQSYTEIISRCPTDPVCNYGCIHGPLIEHFRGEVLTPGQIEEAVTELKKVCEPTSKRPATDLNRVMCYHALGHLSMYITGGLINEALPVCQNITASLSGHEYEICAEGVFMTVFQSADSEDLALVKDIKPEKDGVTKFCADYDGVNFQACRRESYPLFRQELKTPAGLVNFCLFTQSDYDQWKCYATALGDIIINKIGQNLVSDMTDYCLNLPSGLRGQCFANVAGRLVQLDVKNLDEALRVCLSADGYGVAADCYQDLVTFGHDAFILGTDSRTNYCQAFTDPWRKSCLEN